MLYHCKPHTVEDGSVGGEETVLQSLRIIASLESILLKNNIMNIFARKQRYRTTAMTVENAEKGEFGRVNLGVEVGAGGEIQHGGM